MNLKIIFLFIALVAFTTFVFAGDFGAPNNNPRPVPNNNPRPVPNNHESRYSATRKFGDLCDNNYQCGSSLKCDMNVYKCVCQTKFQFLKEAHECVFCPQEEGWIIAQGKCIQLNSGDLTWNEASYKCKNSGGFLLEMNNQLSYHESTRFFENATGTTKFFIGLISAGRSISNWTFPVSDIQVASGAPFWKCNNFPNSFVLRLGDPLRDNGKKCAYVDHHQFVATNCDSREDEVTQYVCQKPDFQATKQVVADSKFSKKIKKDWVGRYCVADRECTIGEFCRNSYCACSFGYTRYDNKCQRCAIGFTSLNGQCYRVSTNATDFKSANLDCLAQNAVLLTLDLEDISEYPRNTFKVFEMSGLKNTWVFAAVNGSSNVDNSSTMLRFDRFDASKSFKEFDMGSHPWTEYAVNTCLQNASASANVTNPNGLLASFEPIFNGNIEQSIMYNCLSLNRNLVSQTNCSTPQNYVCQQPFGGFAPSLINELITRVNNEYNFDQRI